MADVKYTEFAQQAVGLAEFFNEAFKKPLVGRPANYRVQLAVPDGPSTSGGKQGTQHIKLVPIGTGPTIVAGWANPADHEAEIRSWEHIRSIQSERTGGAAASPDEQAYRKLVLDMKKFFENEKLTVSVVAAQRHEEPQAEEDAGGGSSIGIVVGGVLAGLAIVGAAAYFLFLR